MNGSFAGVYVATKPDSPSGFYKIGRSENVGARVSKQGRSMTIVVAIPFSNPLVLEQALHAHFANQRLKGEWFWLEPSDLFFISKIDPHTFIDQQKTGTVPLVTFTEFRSDGWPLCPACGEDELYSFLSMRDPFYVMNYFDEHGSNPPIQEYIDAGMCCYFCSWRHETTKGPTE
jgi:hypothetical protein